MRRPGREAGRRARPCRGDSRPVDTPYDMSPSTGGPVDLGGPEDRSPRIQDTTGLLGAQGRWRGLVWGLPDEY